jgi:hypothetical protein
MAVANAPARVAAQTGSCDSAGGPSSSCRGNPPSAESHPPESALPNAAPPDAAQLANHWIIAETANFRVWCEPGKLPVADVALRCESLRTKLRDKWLAETTPSAKWSPKCSVFLHSTRDSYCAAVGPDAVVTSGTSLTLNQGQRIVERRIDLQIERPDAMTAALPHELTHMILADRFGQTLPRWADEGMAVLAEPDGKRKLHALDLAVGRRQGLLFRMAELLPLVDYPPPDRWAVFYGQSMSVVEYLVHRKSPSDFVTFLQVSTAEGYDRALQKSYGIRNMAELERLWNASLKSNSSEIAVTP